MCGIVGVISTQTLNFREKDIFKELLYIDALRGFHSTGLMAVNNKFGVDTYKKAVSASDFLDLKPVDRIINSANFGLIGHNRAATKGSVNTENAHPFTWDHITMVHNGTLRSTFHLEDNYRFDVDSEAICYSLANKGTRETMRSLNGAYSLIWYDEHDLSINMIRNRERPLFIAPTEKAETIFIASEMDMISWIAFRNNVNLENIYYLEPHYLYSYSMVHNDLQPRVTEMPVYQNAYSYTHHNNNGNNSTRGNNKGKGKNLGQGHSNANVTTHPNSHNHKNNSQQGSSKSTATTKNDTPTKNQRENAEDYILSELGMKRGEWIKFMTMEYKNGPSHYGSWNCLTDKGIEVHVPAVHENQMKLHNEYVGKIQGVTNALTSGDSQVIVVNSTIESVQAVMDNDVGQFLPATTETSEEERSEVWVPGPDAHIPESRFWNLVRNGCCICASPIESDDAESIVWTSNSEPVCTGCIDIYYESYAPNVK